MLECIIMAIYVTKSSNVVIFQILRICRLRLSRGKCSYSLMIILQGNAGKSKFTLVYRPYIFYIISI